MPEHPYIPIPDTAALILGYVNDVGLTWSNTLNFRKTDGWDADELAALAASAIDAWGETLSAAFTTAAHLQQVTARDLSSEDGASIITADTASQAGSRSGNIVPLNAATTVTFRTLQRGRSFRGRIYHYGLVQADLASAKRWTTTSVGVVQASYEAFVNAIQLGTGADLVVVSRRQGNVWLAVGETTEVSQIVGRTPVATQRERVAS